MANHLRAVNEGDLPELPQAKSLVEAAGRGRREYLAKALQTINATIDDGVPAHALARLMNEATAIDAEIRKLEAQEEQDVKRPVGERRSFDRSVI